MKAIGKVGKQIYKRLWNVHVYNLRYGLTKDDLDTDLGDLS